MAPLQLLFLGTGTSTALPTTPCLTRTPYPASFTSMVPLPSTSNPSKGQYDPKGPWPKNIACSCCRSSQDRDVPEGWKNRRGNTSAVLRKKVNGKWKNVVVDVGKTFRAQSIQYFPRWGVETIDAVILTHGHADAYFGLDDLREFCIRQGTTIPIYLNQPTYESVAKSFPYLVDSTQASGGGDLPSLKFHLIDHDAEFEVETIKVKALPLEHGIYFNVPPSSGENGADSPALKPEPLICLGFLFDDAIAYMSDVSNVPDRTWDKLLLRGEGQKEPSSKPTPMSATSLRERLKPVTSMIPPTPENQSRSASPHRSVEQRLNELSVSAAEDTHPPPPLPILIIDALWPWRTHISHINLPQALDIAVRLQPQMTYIVGMTHPLSHFMWEELGRSIRGEDGQQAHPESAMAKTLVRRVWSDKQFQGDQGKKYYDWAGRVMPAWDGLVVEVGGENGWRECKEDSVEGWIC